MHVLSSLRILGFISCNGPSVKLDIGWLLHAMYHLCIRDTIIDQRDLAGLIFLFIVWYHPEYLLGTGPLSCKSDVSRQSSVQLFRDQKMFKYCLQQWDSAVRSTTIVCKHQSRRGFSLLKNSSFSAKVGKGNKRGYED